MLAALGLICGSSDEKASDFKESSDNGQPRPRFKCISSDFMYVQGVLASKSPGFPRKTSPRGEHPAQREQCQHPRLASPLKQAKGDACLPEASLNDLALGEASASDAALHRLDISEALELSICTEVEQENICTITAVPGPFSQLGVCTEDLHNFAAVEVDPRARMATVKAISGDRLCSVTVWPHMLVGSLKERIMEATEIPVGVQRLVVGTNVLRDTDDLGSRLFPGGDDGQGVTILLIVQPRRCVRCGALCGGKLSECLVEYWECNGFDDGDDEEEGGWKCNWCEAAS